MAARKAVPVDLSVTAAVKRDLEALAKRDAKLAQSGLAATALALARELDDDNSATSKSMCARALSETLVLLNELAPPEQVLDGIDDLEKARSKRRSAA